MVTAPDPFPSRLDVLVILKSRPDNDVFDRLIDAHNTWPHNAPFVFDGGASSSAQWFEFSVYTTADTSTDAATQVGEALGALILDVAGDELDGACVPVTDRFPSEYRKTVTAALRRTLGST